MGLGVVYVSDREDFSLTLPIDTKVVNRLHNRAEERYEFTVSHPDLPDTKEPVQVATDGDTWSVR